MFRLVWEIHHPEKPETDLGGTIYGGAVRQRNTAYH